MSKSIYSLVLNDEVIALIDSVALKRGEARSTLVNRILSEYLGIETAEKRIDSMFNFINALIEKENRMRLLSKTRDSGFSIVSALNYKYSPRITYAFEIKPSTNSFGELIISFRTSKSDLLDDITSFFAQVIAIEKSILTYDVTYTAGDNKIRRTLHITNPNLTAEQIASIITDYVRNLDALLNKYIAENPAFRDRLLLERFVGLDTLNKI